MGYNSGMSYLALKDRDADAANHARVMGRACAGTPEDFGAGPGIGRAEASAARVGDVLLPAEAMPGELLQGEQVDDAVVDAVQRDLAERKRLGMVRYGKPLRLGYTEGRNPILEAYQESLDKAVYLRWAIDEREAMQKRIAELESLVYTYPPTEPYAPDGQTWKQMADHCLKELKSLRHNCDELDDENARLRALADQLCDRLAITSAALGRAAERRPGFLADV